MLQSNSPSKLDRSISLISALQWLIILTASCWWRHRSATVWRRRLQTVRPSVVFPVLSGKV